MREILFRGKLGDGEWLEGVAFPYDSGKVAILSQHPIDGSLVGFEVIPETVGEYTGLTDKNGKKIFEGDILRFPYPSTQNIYSVMWSGGSFVRKDPDGYYLSLNALNCDEYKVIGNIHDNPELLEGEYNG